jgi:hypothetical protein
MLNHHTFAQGGIEHHAFKTDEAAFTYLAWSVHHGTMCQRGAFPDPNRRSSQSVNDDAVLDIHLWLDEDGLNLSCRTWFVGPDDCIGSDKNLFADVDVTDNNR